jgi:hypothetical protein
LAINRELLKERDSLNRVEAVNTRLTEDVKNLLSNMQKDYQSRLEVRVTEIVNRIVMEHEERLRSTDEIRQNFDLRDKLIQEKTNYEKEEMRERYIALDGLVRAEFQRKEEMIRSLQLVFENQIKSMQNAIQVFKINFLIF